MKDSKNPQTEHQKVNLPCDFSLIHGPIFSNLETMHIFMKDLV